MQLGMQSQKGSGNVQTSKPLKDICKQLCVCVVDRLLVILVVLAVIKQSLHSPERARERVFVCVCVSVCVCECVCMCVCVYVSA